MSVALIETNARIDALMRRVAELENDYGAMQHTAANLAQAVAGMGSHLNRLTGMAATHPLTEHVEKAETQPHVMSPVVSSVVSSATGGTPTPTKPAPTVKLATPVRVPAP